MQRITPAHAGKSFYRNSHRRQLFHHPRTRGEKQLPRMPPRLQYHHPRTRGEKVVSFWDSGIFLGSPPHTRGKGLCRRKRHTQDRITPAHAGKSHFPEAITFFDGDHPRARGEKPTIFLLGENEIESPPRTRGKAPSVSSSVSVSGITPAHAGKRSWYSSYDTPSKDHPRTRGEKFRVRWKRLRR